MPLARSILTRLSAFMFSGRFSSLSTGIVMAMCAGLLLPAIIGGLALANLNQERMDQELKVYLNDKVELLANSLANPVWNFDSDAVRTITDTSFLDPQLVRIMITLSTEPTPFLSVERAERRLGKSRLAKRQLMLANTRIGDIEIEIDDGLKQREFEKARLAYALVLLGQFVLALVLILITVRYGILKPLVRLASFSGQLARGDLEHPLKRWNRSDEIGQLAQQMDQMRSSLRTSFSEQQAILSNIQVGVLFVREETIQLANRHAEQIFGYEPTQMQGLAVRHIYVSDDQFSATSNRSDAVIATASGIYEEVLLLKNRAGGVFWAQMRGCALDPDTAQAGSIWVIDDITARKAAENEINSLAFYDPLTRLPNRRLLLDRLNHALVSNSRNKRNGALLFLDLDDFKTLNDTLGHDLGDLLLRQVAERLSACIREGDTVARLGGDEFVVILEELSESVDEAITQSEAIGQKILHEINQTYHLASHQHHSSASIGITLFADQQNTIEDLLKRADLAMYQAKAAGRNTLRFYDPEMQAVVTARAVLESGLHEAILKGQFLLHYQIQVAGDGQITGAEALVRWSHPERGLISPADFIPLAEDTGQILPLGHWVLRTACTQLARWAAQQEMAHLSIAVNVSARQLHSNDFVHQVLSVLEHTGANPNRLKLELTESLLVSNVEDVISKMSALKGIGVGFSLDDFGTGYSSLAYLKRLPLDQLKIDQGFVRDILIDPNDAAIAKMVVALAESLGLSVIAEGVETEAQRDFLARHGCNAFQGYLFGHPLPLGEFESLVKRETGRGHAQRPPAPRLLVS